MESKSSESLWQRTHSTWAELRRAKKRFRGSVGDSLSARYTALASAHYSLAGRYSHGVWQLLGAYFLYNAVCNAEKAWTAAYELSELTINQLDVLSRIYAKTPVVLGGDLTMAWRLVDYALLEHPQRRLCLPHTQAHLLITRGIIFFGRSDLPNALIDHETALSLRERILSEESADKEKQLVRVLRGVGAFFRDHGHGLYRERGEKLLAEAEVLAEKCSADQLEKVRAVR